MATVKDCTPTARQKEVLDYIREYRRERGISPTIRECMRALGLTSPNGLKCHLDALVKKGRLKRTGFTARSLVPAEEAGQTLYRVDEWNPRANNGDGSWAAFPVACYDADRDEASAVFSRLKAEGRTVRLVRVTEEVVG